MQNVGDRLAEARKRLGIALREASEATKIRTDYLIAMENGSFEFSLPEIYKVGFLKIYARYLKLDADKLAADYATQFSTTGRETLGRMDAPGSHPAGGVAGRDAAANDYDSDRAKKQAELYRLIAFLAVALVVLVLFIVGLQKLLMSGSPAEDATKTASAAAAASTTPAPDAAAPAPAPILTPPAPPAPGSLKIVFAATGDISSLQVTQVNGRKSLYNLPLKKGTTASLTSVGPVEIKVSEAQFLTIKVNNGPLQGLGGPNGKTIIGPAGPFTWPVQ